MLLKNRDPNIFALYGHDFQVFVLSPKTKNKNLEITKFLQKHHNTEMYDYSFKNPLKCWSRNMTQSNWYS